MLVRALRVRNGDIVTVSQLLEYPSCQVRRPGRVAGAAADDEPTIGLAPCCDLADVVGGQVGGLVGGLASPAWAPVADDGAVVGDDAAPSFAFLGVVVQVGAACSLGALVVAFAVGAS